ATGELSEVWGEINQAAGSAERLGELLEVQSEIKSPARPVVMPEPPRGEIAFRDITFHYPSRPAISALAGVSFGAKKGERVAIVGPSGAGKTTIFALLLRFYDPQKGTVSVDGVPVNQADLHALRSRFAIVPQEPALFADTVAANIGYGVGEASRAEIEKAARAAFAHDFIAALPRGYDTMLGEATSALDSESETLVQRALDAIMQGRTTLVIAHRLATVTRADRIRVLDQGRLVEEGTHQSLLGNGGIYARLAELQFTTDAA